MFTRSVRLLTSSFVLSIALSLSTVAPARAQQAPAPPPAREGTAEASFVGTSGNASTQALGLGAALIARTGPWTVTSKAAFVRNEVENVVSAQALTASSRAERLLRPRVSMFTQYGYLRDRFAGIAHRNVIDAGVQVALLKTERQQWDLEAGVGYANERRLVGTNLSSAEVLAGMLYKVKISPTAEFSDTLRFDSALSDDGTWRTANTAAITAKLTDMFSLKVSNSVRYVREPVPGFKSTDVLTAVALVAKF